MVRPIVLYGDKSLKISSAEINRGGLMNVTGLISDMFETMHKANGVGLAAIQIGVPLRLFVIEAHLESENFHIRETFLNPNIIRKFGAMIKHPEGCLSIPGIAALVERPSNIEIEWWDENWVYHKQEFDGIAARIIQHEYDHLDGNLYVDKLDKMWSEMINESLEIIKNRKIEVTYLTK